jgi:hypothetical protein
MVQCANEFFGCVRNCGMVCMAITFGEVLLCFDVFCCVFAGKTSPFDKRQEQQKNGGQVSRVCIFCSYFYCQIPGKLPVSSTW